MKPCENCQEFDCYGCKYKLNNCDNCTYYHWYYDYCDKWKCEVDERSIYSCFERKNKI